MFYFTALAWSTRWSLFTLKTASSTVFTAACRLTIWERFRWLPFPSPRTRWWSRHSTWTREWRFHSCAHRNNVTTQKTTFCAFFSSNSITKLFNFFFSYLLSFLRCRSQTLWHKVNCCNYLWVNIISKWKKILKKIIKLLVSVQVESLRKFSHSLNFFLIRRKTFPLYNS